jgi:hypothetical protein
MPHVDPKRLTTAAPDIGAQRRVVDLMRSLTDPGARCAETALSAPS